MNASSVLRRVHRLVKRHVEEVALSRAQLKKLHPESFAYEEMYADWMKRKEATTP